MGFPWKKIFTLGLAVASSQDGKVGDIAKKVGAISDVVISAIHDAEHTDKTGPEKLIAVEARTIQAINEVAAALGKGDIIDDDLRTLIIAATNANVALENAVAAKLKS